MFLLLCFNSTTHAQRYMENLDRGVVAVKTGSKEVFVSWRLLGTDPDATAFNIYRGEKKINKSPISSTTSFTDNEANGEIYTIQTILNDKEQPSTASAFTWNKQYLSVPLNRPEGGTTPDDVNYTYQPNDISVGDLDGDGSYEIVLKWNPTNAKDNSHEGYTGNVFIDAYKMDGKLLWRIDLGRNIRAGAHYTQFIVYDLDSDGKAEVAIKTADGTVDGNGKVIGDAQADFRDSNGKIMEGSEFLTIFNGETGAAMATTNYLPGRGNVAGWGDSKANRSDRFLAGLGYFDGERPSLLMARGYYTRSVLVAWDWRDGKLTQRWIFDSDTPDNERYAGQGNHQLTVADVDQDGKDEVIYGSMAVDDDGSGLYTTELGHGDAMHVTDMDPDRPGMEIWTCNESPSQYQGNGLWYRDAGTGEKLWGVPATDDVGRALASDIDPRYKGYEMWGSTGGLYKNNGELISKKRPTMNFAVWWDGDLQRELLDGTKVDKWDYENNALKNLLSADAFGAEKNNGTKSNPGISADILGDWREEIILRHENNQELLVFTTTIPSKHRFYTLMHDPQYRISIAWQNVAYNQPPHTSYYLGEGMKNPSKPNIKLTEEAKLGAKGGR